MTGSMTGVLADLLWWAVAKAPLVLAGAALTAWVLRDASAATRHRIWATAVVMTLALPLLALVVPRLRVALPLDPPAMTGSLPALVAVPIEPAPVPAPPSARAFVASQVGTAPAPPPPRAVTPATVPLPPSAPSPLTVPPAPAFADAGSPASSARALVVLVWLIVATGLLLRIVVDRVRTRRLECAQADACGSWLGRAVHAVASERGVHDVRVLVGAPDAMPVTWGWRRPVLLLPAGAEAWPAHRLEAVVRHELAHVRRGDVVLQLLGDVLCALHWFDPLAWYAAHRMRIERELACDDEVLAAGTRPSDYASELVGLARRFREARVAGIAMARRNGLRARVESVLDERRRRGESRQVNRLIHGLALLLALPLAAFVPYAAAEPASGTTAVVGEAPRAAFAARAAASSATLVAPIEAAQLATLCWDDLNGGSNRVQRNDDRFELEWERGGCSVDIRVDGEVRFSGDFTRIVGLDRGGFARFEERDGRRERRVEIRPDDDGVELRWFVDGDERPFDAEAERWLDAMLLNTFRSGGLATEERALWLLRERGLDALLEEIGHLRGDWVRGNYYRIALESPDLDDARAVRVIEQAASTIGSDHTLMQVLQTVAQRRSLSDPALRSAFIAATAEIGSDHAAARVLETALTGTTLPDRDLAAILDAVARIGSDHEQMQLLVRVARQHRLSPELRAAYLRVVSSISSDHATGRAAHALLDAGDPSADELALALDIAREIGSDHEQGQLLERLGAIELRDADLRRSYEAALDGIGSDHTLGQVLMALMRDRDMDEATAGVVLRAARSIGSDHTLGQVLATLVRQGGVTAETRAAFDEALASIGSDHTREQVQRALSNR